MEQTDYLRTGCKPDGQRYGEDQIGTEIVDFYQTWCELLRTDSATDPCEHLTMQKGKNPAKSARTTLASVKREMLEPRLTESVREALRDEPALVVEKPSAGSRKVSAPVTPTSKGRW
jgi:hypothetical protein